MSHAVWRRVGVMALGTILVLVVVCGGSLVGNQPALSASPGPLVPLTFQLNFTAGGYNAGFALALQKGLPRDPVPLGSLVVSL